MTTRLEAVDALSAQIATCDEAIEQAVKADPVALRLMTAPGVGSIVASYYLMAVRNPGRIKSGRQVGAYLGLVPSLYESGQISRRGRKRFKSAVLSAHAVATSRWSTSMDTVEHSSHARDHQRQDPSIAHVVSDGS